MKFQWAKFSSMLDYDELIKVYGIAVNSAGMTEKQIAMQMDTIARKAEQLKATLTGLATNSGGELSRLIKAGIGEVTNFLNVLNNVSRGTYDTIGAMVKASIAIYGLARAYKSIGIVMGIYSTAMLAGSASANVNTVSQGLNSGAQISNAMAQGAKAVATGVNTVSTNVNTAAQTRNAIATTIATGGLNLLIPLLVGSALAFDAYSISTDGASSSLDKLGKSTDSLSKMEEDMGTKENLIQSLKQRYDYVDTLTNAHTKLTAALGNETEGSKEYNKLQKSLGATQEELAHIVGVSTEEIVQDGVLRMDLINQEKDNMETKAGDIRTEIKELKNAQITYTQQSIQSAQDRIDALGKETSAWGYLAQAQMWAMEQYNGVMKMQIKAKTALFNMLPSAMNSERSQLAASIQSDEAYSASLENYRPASVTNEINANAEKINSLKLKQAQIAMSNIDYDTVNQGSDVGEGTPKKGKASHDTSNGGVPPNDPNRAIERDAYKDAVTIATHRAKLATDEYTASLDTLNTTEEMYGKTADSTVNKLDLMQKRWQALNDQEFESQTNADTLNAQLDTMIGDTGALGISKSDYDAMTKAKRAELKIQYRDVLDAHKDLKAVTAAYYAWEDKASKERLEKTKLGNDIKKGELGYKPEELYKTKLDRNNVTQDILIAQNTNKLDMNNDVTLNAIRLHKMQEDAKFHAEEQIRLNKVVSDAKIAVDKVRNTEYETAAQKELDTAQLLADKQRAIVAKNTQDIADLEYSKNSKIREGLAGITQDVLIQGNSLKNVWKNLWNQLANSAIQALFRVQGGTGGLLGSLIGMFGGGGVARPSGVSGPLRANGLFADGGIVDKPTNALIGETGEQETVINLGKLAKGDQRQQGLLGYANSKLGTSKGTSVVPNISPRTQQIAENASNNREHIAKIEESNILLRSLCSIMINKEMGGGQGSTQIAVLPTTQGDGDLYAQLSRMRNSGYNV